MKKVATNVLWLFFFLISAFEVATASPGDEGGIRIETITPGVKNGQITVSARFRNLFSKKIVGTIQSGLPSIIQIEMKLLEGKEKTLVHKTLMRRISYDIWQERYAIDSPDSTQILTDFEAVKKVSSALQDEPLVQRQKLRPTSRYTIELRVGIIPISTRQAEKVSDWLLDPNQVEEPLASDNRSSGFELNISKLVSFFVNRKKGSRYRSEPFRSKPFKLSDLHE